MARTIFLLVSLIFLSKAVCSHDNVLNIPGQKSQVNSWFAQNVGPVSARKSTLDPPLVRAKSNPKTIEVRADGLGDFKTIRDAIESIPKNNANRVIVSIGPGTYVEKNSIPKNKPFVTFYGDPNNIPLLVFNGTAAQFKGTRKSATLMVKSDYFVGVNLNIVNAAAGPIPTEKEVGQAVALTIQGDKAAFYNCYFIGFQNTLCDDNGRHFYKDCYIEGAVDFIFGQGKSIYLNTETRVFPNQNGASITEQERPDPSKDSGYSFIHCTVTGLDGIAYLGRALQPYATVVFAYSEMGDVVKPEGWSDNEDPVNDEKVYYGEYKNEGPGSRLDMRAPYTKKLTDAEAANFLKLDFIKGSQWLLPPPQVK